MNFSDTAAFEFHLKMSRVSKGVFALNGYTISRSLDNLDVSADQTNISCIVSIIVLTLIILFVKVGLKVYYSKYGNSKFVPLPVRLPKQTLCESFNFIYPRHVMQDLPTEVCDVCPQEKNIDYCKAVQNVRSFIFF